MNVVDGFMASKLVGKYTKRPHGMVWDTTLPYKTPIPDFFLKYRTFCMAPS